MTRTQNLLYLFETNGNQLTLKQMLDNGYLIGSRYTSRVDDLRKLGYSVTCKQNRERPTENVYTLLPPVRVEPNGQEVFL
jgi:hypothetical protein